MENAKFRFISGRNSLEFFAPICTPQHWAAETIKNLIRFREISLRIFHQGDTHEWVRFYPPVRLQYFHDNKWMSAQGCIEPTDDFAPAQSAKSLVRPEGERSDFAVVDNFYKDRILVDAKAEKIIDTLGEDFIYIEEIKRLLGFSIDKAF